MNLEIVLQLSALALIVLTGPVVVGLLVLKKGNL